MAGMTAGHRRPSAYYALAAVLLLTSCSTQAGLTLSDFGAEELEGLGGEGLADRCQTLPAPESIINLKCSQGAGLSTSEVSVSPGTLGALLLCDGGSGVEIQVESNSKSFPPVELGCPSSDGVAITELADVAAGGTWTISVRTTGAEAIALFLAQ